MHVKSGMAVKGVKGQGTSGQRGVHFRAATETKANDQMYLVKVSISVHTHVNTYIMYMYTYIYTHTYIIKWHVEVDGQEALGAMCEKWDAKH